MLSIAFFFAMLFTISLLHDLQLGSKDLDAGDLFGCAFCWAVIFYCKVCQ